MDYGTPGEISVDFHGKPAISESSSRCRLEIYRNWWRCPSFDDMTIDVDYPPTEVGRACKQRQSSSLADFGGRDFGS